MTSYSWKGTGPSHTGDWDTASNWTPTGIPGSGDTAIIDRGAVSLDISESGEPGLEIGALDIGANGSLIVGDSANANRAILTVDGLATGKILGLVTIYGDASSQSELRLAGKVVTSSSTSTGTIDIVGGTLTAVGSLDLTGDGLVELGGGYIGGSSQTPTDTLTTSTTISGVGVLDAANDYSGSTEYNGLTTNNHGVIDATNLASGENFLTVAGGTVDNYNLMEATNSVAGSSGYAVLDLTDGAVIRDFSGGSLAATAGAFVSLEGATIINGSLSGEIGTYGSGNTIESVGTGNTLTNEGDIFVSNGSLSLAGKTGEIVNDATIEVDAGGSLKLSGSIDNSLNGTITVDEGGVLTTASTNDLFNSGALVADGGDMTFSEGVQGGSVTIENGGVFTFNSNGGSDFDVGFAGNPGGALVFGTRDANGSSVLDGTVSGFDYQGGATEQDDDVMTFENIGYSSCRSATSCSWTQSNAAQGILTLPGASILLDGLYAPVGSSYTFGVNGTNYMGQEGPLHFSIEHGTDGQGHILPGVSVDMISSG